MTRTRFAALLAALAIASAPGSALAQTDREAAPEAATGIAASGIARAQTRMVAAANPLAAQAGLEALRRGGGAADAMVVIQTVLGLVEPQSSGIGGGAFLVWYDAASGEITTFDARETAPAAAAPELFMGEDGEPLAFFDAVIGGRSVGAPGVVRLFETVHARHGRLDWADLFEPAIELAEAGFEVSPRLAALIAGDAGRLDRDAAARGYFFRPDGAPLEAGDPLRNPDYAQTLRLIAAGGAEAFYEGVIADAIVEAVAGHGDNPGLLDRDDLAGYRVVEREPVCIEYRQLDVCGMGPPSSGALTVGQTLGILSQFDLAALGPGEPEAWRLIGDATRLAFADRGLYMADSDFVDMPGGLLDRDYLTGRAALMRGPEALPAEAVTPGEPPWDRAGLRLPGEEPERRATTHFVIVDDEGNIASMTSSIESAFGARIMAAGFLLNNQLTDFSFRPGQEGALVANRVEPGKRPRSSMSPTIVLRDGRPVHALGSPGGAAIIPYVARTMVALADWELEIDEAISLPHLVNMFGTYVLEAGTSAEDFAEPLTAMGYEIAVRDLNSGLHVITIGTDGLTGAADPRREGVALGD